MTIKLFALLTVALMGSVTASAQTTKRIPLPASQNPSGADLPFSAAVWAGDTLYVSGWLDPDLKTHTDTTSQTVGIIKDIQKLLESQNLTLGDVVMMRVYLGGDPAKGGKMDVAGARAGYSQFFGTKDQPNKPACTTVQVVLPAGDRGALIEIDVVAVRPSSGRLRIRPASKTRKTPEGKVDVATRLSVSWSV
ncbi:MAG TPA: Rid family hydrolase [Candidatus Sulfotelmatobacter sp.]